MGRNDFDVSVTRLFIPIAVAVFVFILSGCSGPWQVDMWEPRTLDPVPVENRVGWTLNVSSADLGEESLFVTKSTTPFMLNGSPAAVLFTPDYLQDNSGSVWLTRLLGSDSYAWDEPVTLFDKSCTSVFPVVLDGKPSILLNQTVGDDYSPVVFLISALDAAGDTWADARQIFTDRYLIDVVEIGGTIDIIFTKHNDADETGLYFARSLDSTCTSWSEPKLLYDYGYSYYPAKFAKNADKPAFVLGHKTQGGLYYFQSTDAVGDSWNYNTVRDSANASIDGGGFDCCFIDGVPVVVFITNKWPNYLRFSKAVDAGASSWNKPAMIADNASGDVSVNEIGGKPAVAYTDFYETGTGCDWGIWEGVSVLKYIEADSADGTKWSDPVVLRSDYTYEKTSYGVDLKLYDVSGKPAIVYKSEKSPDFEPQRKLECLIRN